jgi:TP901 family phage tail tape measure protein
MTASQRAASVAQAVGSSQDSFLAAIATIESVTRQSAEEIGNGLKTIYQRFADIQVSGSTEDGVDYGQYAQALKSIGVDVLDAAGEFKGMDQILQETQEVWSSLSDTMKVAVGEKVAGKFQYNRFAALMNNPEYYQKAYNATQGASGMMDQMNEYYTQGIEGRLNTLQAAGEQVMSTLFDQDNIEPVIKAATDFLNIINTIIDTVGGGVPVFTALSAVILKTFSAQIGEQAARIATNISTMIQGSQNVKQMQTTLTGLQASGITTNTDTYKYAKNSVSSMVGLSSNTQQE